MNAEARAVGAGIAGARRETASALMEPFADNATPATNGPSCTSQQEHTAGYAVGAVRCAELAYLLGVSRTPRALSGNGAPLSRAGSVGVTEAARYGTHWRGYGSAFVNGVGSNNETGDVQWWGRRITVNYQVEYRRIWLSVGGCDGCR